MEGSGSRRRCPSLQMCIWGCGMEHSLSGKGCRSLRLQWARPRDRRAAGPGSGGWCPRLDMGRPYHDSRALSCRKWKVLKGFWGETFPKKGAGTLGGGERRETEELSQERERVRQTQQPVHSSASPVRPFLPPHQLRFLRAEAWEGGLGGGGHTAGQGRRLSHVPSVGGRPARAEGEAMAGTWDETP